MLIRNMAGIVSSKRSCNVAFNYFIVKVNVVVLNYSAISRRGFV